MYKKNATNKPPKGAKKYAMLKSVQSVDRTDTQTPMGHEITLHAYMQDGREMVFTFIEGGTIETATMRYNDASGRWKRWGKSQLETPLQIDKDEVVYATRYRVVRSGCQIYYNEWIWQLDRIHRGLPVVLGEYNHWLARISQLPELIGIGVGDVVDISRNAKHRGLVLSIHEDTGLWVSVPSVHSTAYALNGLDNITVADIMSHGYIVHGHYIEIVSEDKYRWCVAYNTAAGLIKILPVLWDSQFQRAFGSHFSIIAECDTKEQALAEAYKVKAKLESIYTDSNFEVSIFTSVK